MAKKIKLGEQYRDQVSGFVGIATARYEYLNGCVRIELTGEVTGESKSEIPIFVFDIAQVDQVKPARKTTVKPSDTGGPQTSAPVAR